MLGLIDSFRDDCEACSKLLLQGIGRYIDPFGHNFLIIAQGIRILCYRAHGLCHSSSVTSHPLQSVKHSHIYPALGWWFLDFWKNLQFQVFEKKSEIKRTGWLAGWLSPGIWKTSEWKNHEFWVFQDPQRTARFYDKSEGSFPVLWHFKFCRFQAGGGANHTKICLLVQFPGAFVLQFDLH